MRLSQALLQAGPRWTHPERGLLIASGIASTGSLSSLLGLFGLFVALVALLFAWREHTIFAIVAFHLGILFVDGMPPLWALTLLELAVILLVIRDFQTLQRWDIGVAFGIGGLLSGGIVLLLAQQRGTTITTGIIAISVGVVMYLVHRYEQLQLGLLEE